MVVILALPLAMLAFAGCNASVLPETTADDGSCSAKDPCPSDATCVLPPNACEAGARGTCQTIFQCDGPPSGPLCDCDGKVVEGEYPDCEPERAGESFGDSVPCQTGTFACGPTLKCKRNSDVCVERLVGDPAPATYECASFKSVNQWCQHDIPDCGCLNATPFAEGMFVMCKADADHQETITVPAP